MVFGVYLYIYLLLVVYIPISNGGCCLVMMGL